MSSKKWTGFLFFSFAFFLAFQNCQQKKLTTYNNVGALPNSVSSTEEARLPDESTATKDSDGFRISSVTFLSGSNVSAISMPRSNYISSEVSSLEMPPVMLGKFNGVNYSIISSFESFLCSTASNISSPFQFPIFSCRLVSTPVVDSSRRTYSFTADQIKTEPQWKRNYSGIFSAHTVNSMNFGSALIAITHYENKGESHPYTGLGSGEFLNSIGPRMKNLVGTTANGKCLESNGCYFASVGLQWRPLANVIGNQDSSATNDFYDAGPITWPSAGYVSADGLKKISDGPRHPYSIIKDGYIYVFYIDQIYTNGTDNNYENYKNIDRQSGLKVIRAPVSNFSPKHWRAYYNGQFSETTLPVNFNPNAMTSFASSLGPRTTVVFGENSTLRVSFSVAKIKGTNSYVGAETYLDFNQGTCDAPGMFKVALRTSEDLVHWSQRKDIYGCLDRNNFGLSYAKFLDSTGNTNYEIDPNDFYLIGTSGIAIDNNAWTTKNYSTALNVIRLKIAN